MKKVLFVCIENSCRSQMAEAFAKMYGKGKVEAYSSGSKPSGQVNPKAIASMQAIGYDLSKHQSKSIDDLGIDEFDYAITMGCGDECPYVRAKKRMDWNIPDPKMMEPEEFEKVRDLVEEKVRDFLGDL